MADNRDIIRRVRIFATLGDADCDAVLRIIKARRGEAGTVLFREGEPGATMIIVAEGELVAQVNSKLGAVEVARFGVGEVVGEAAVIDPAPRSATVTASARSLVYEFSRDGLKQLEQESPAAASALVRAVIRDVARRLREINQRIELELTGQVQRPSMSGEAPRSRRASMMGEPPVASQRSTSVPTPRPAMSPLAQPPPQSTKPALGKLLDKMRGNS
ncbi:MAG: Crp/Fnr family transcriptional regulator [Polyangiales bacterium]